MYLIPEGVRQPYTVEFEINIYSVLNFFTIPGMPSFPRSYLEWCWLHNSWRCTSILGLRNCNSYQENKNNYAQLTTQFKNKFLPTNRSIAMLKIIKSILWIPWIFPVCHRTNCHSKLECQLFSCGTQIHSVV